MIPQQQDFPDMQNAVCVLSSCFGSVSLIEITFNFKVKSVFKFERLNIQIRNLRIEDERQASTCLPCLWSSVELLLTALSTYLWWHSLGTCTVFLLAPHIRCVSMKTDSLLVIQMLHWMKLGLPVAFLKCFQYFFSKSFMDINELIFI